MQVKLLIVSLTRDPTLEDFGGEAESYPCNDVVCCKEVHEKADRLELYVGCTSYEKPKQSLKPIIRCCGLPAGRAENVGKVIEQRDDMPQPSEEQQMSRMTPERHAC